MKSKRIIAAVALCSFNWMVWNDARADEYWSQFRGPSGNGVSQVSQGPLSWTETDQVVWKVRIPGVGWSSPVHAGGYIWLTTAVPTAMTPEEQDTIRDREFSQHAVGKALVFVRDVRFHALAIDPQSGAIVHDLELLRSDHPKPIHSLNSYASPTPVVTDSQLYCHFGSYGTVCVDVTTGGIVWKTVLPHDESVGPGSSPTLYQDRLFIPCDGVDQQYVVALDVADGSIAWRAKRPPMQGTIGEYHKAFSTPTILEHAGRVQVVILGAQWLVSYDSETGREWWRLNHGQGFSSAVRPIIADGMIIVATGFGNGQLIAVDPSGSGDVTDTHLRWSHSQQAPTMPSPIAYGNRIYMVSDNGIATCLETKTGSVIWRQRLGGNFSASPIRIGKRLYFCNREGTTRIIEAGEEYEELAENQLDGPIMASPILLGSDLIIRTDPYLYRIGARKHQSKGS